MQHVQCMFNLFHRRLWRTRLYYLNRSRRFSWKMNSNFLWLTCSSFGDLDCWGLITRVSRIIFNSKSHCAHHHMRFCLVIVWSGEVTRFPGQISLNQSIGSGSIASREMVCGSWTFGELQGMPHWWNTGTYKRVTLWHGLQETPGLYISDTEVTVTGVGNLLMGPLKQMIPRSTFKPEYAVIFRIFVWLFFLVMVYDCFLIEF